MRIFLSGIFILLFISVTSAKDEKGIVRGKVSYVTTKSIYVRLNESGRVGIGDTVFVTRMEKRVPLFIVKSHSSISCMGTLLSETDVSAGEDVFVAIVIKGKKVIASEVDKRVSETDTLLAKEKPEQKPLRFKQKIRGKISVATYAGFSGSTKSDYFRNRYTVSSQVSNISNSRFSSDVYISFTHKTNNWQEVKDNMFNALKIYSLNLKYQAGEKTTIALGRKINRNLSSIGAVDGLQYETRIRSFKIGAIVGFRPDYKDYSLNTDLAEYGAFVSHEYKNKSGYVQNSIAFFDQYNGGKTDRRFLYFQHSNSLVNNLYFFLSGEADLYSIKDSVPENSFSLTNFYISARYNVIKQLSLYLSYDDRKNVIYYETFKSISDQLLDEARRQSFGVRVNYRASNFLSTGVSATYRVRDNDIRPTRTLNGFVTFTDIQWLDAMVTLSTNILQNSNLGGKIISCQIRRDIFNNKVSSGIGYRMMNYDYYNSDSKSLQNSGEVDITLRMSHKISFSVNYEITFESSTSVESTPKQMATYNRCYLNLVKRF